MSYTVKIHFTNTYKPNAKSCIADIFENGEKISRIVAVEIHPYNDNVAYVTFASRIMLTIARHISEEAARALEAHQLDVALRLLCIHPIPVEYGMEEEEAKGEKQSREWGDRLLGCLNSETNKYRWLRQDGESFDAIVVSVLAEALKEKNDQGIIQTIEMVDRESDARLSQVFDSTFFEFQQVDANADNATVTTRRATLTKVIEYFLSKEGWSPDSDEILSKGEGSIKFPHTSRSLAHSIVRYAKTSGDLTWLILMLKQPFVSPDTIEAVAPLLYLKAATRDGINQLFELALDTDMQYRLLAVVLDKEAESVLLEYPAGKQAHASASREAAKLLEVRRSLWGVPQGNFLGDQKFLTFLEKLIKTGKALGAIHGLHSYFVGLLCYYGLHEHGIKRLCDCYIKCFIALKQYELLGKYYPHIEALNQNLEFLEAMIPYFLEINEPERAAEALERMTQLEPSYPFLATATREIERCRLVKSLASQNIDLQSLDSLSGQEFEALIIRKFREMGFDAQPTPSTGDFGADILVENKEQTRFVIQCKRFKAKVNLKAVQEVVAALAHFNGDIGIVITNNTFLNSAVKLAESNDIELWDSMKLMRFLAGDLSFSAIGECGE